MYELFEHTADIGLRIRAAGLDELFAEAGRALFSLLVANPGSVRLVDEFEVEIAGDRCDDLLFDWLAELLYKFDVEHVLAAQFEVNVNSQGLRAVVRGEPVDRDRHELDMEVKAITYHGLKVEQQDGQWLAEVIVDI
jgi:SHS2 domain-containing protein